MNTAIIEYRDECVCSHKGLVLGLASSEVQFTIIFLKKTTNLQAGSQVRSRNHQSGQNGWAPSALPNPIGNEPSTSLSNITSLMS